MTDKRQNSIGFLLAPRTKFEEEKLSWQLHHIPGEVVQWLTLLTVEHFLSCTSVKPPLLHLIHAISCPFSLAPPFSVFQGWALWMLLLIYPSVWGVALEWRDPREWCREVLGADPAAELGAQVTVSGLFCCQAARVCRDCKSSGSLGAVAGVLESQAGRRTISQGHSGWRGSQDLFSNQKICILYLKSYVVLG